MPVGIRKAILDSTFNWQAFSNLIVLVFFIFSSATPGCISIVYNPRTFLFIILTTQAITHIFYYLKTATKFPLNLTYIHIGFT